MDNLDLLSRALDQMHRIVAGISHPEQDHLPTPCADWDVTNLARHVIGQDLPQFTVSARGETPDWQSGGDDLRDDWSADLADRARTLIHLWRDGDPDRPVAGRSGSEMPLRTRADQQIAELAIHGWDLAKATGQSLTLDDDVAEHALKWSNRMLTPENRGTAFGPEVSVPTSAPMYERLAGWFGRDPAWSPSNS